MSPRKINKAFSLAGITMPSVIEHITRNLMAESNTIETMTAKQLASVIKVHHAAYHDGRSDAGAEVIDDCIWHGDRLTPLAALKKIETTERFETIRTAPYNGARGCASGMIVDADGKNVPDADALKLWDIDRDAAKKLWWTRRDHVTTYSLNYTERV